jgi:hypothetical protein
MDQTVFPEKGPIKKDDVDFMGTKREKILDFGPIGGKTAGDILPGSRFGSRTSRQIALPETGSGSEHPDEVMGRSEIVSLASLMRHWVPRPLCPSSVQRMEGFRALCSMNIMLDKHQLADIQLS